MACKFFGEKSILIQNVQKDPKHLNFVIIYLLFFMRQKYSLCYHWTYTTVLYFHGYTIC